MGRFSFDPIGNSYAGVVIAAVVLAGLLVIGPARSKTTRRKRLALAALRVAVIVLVLAAMLRPTLVYTQTTPQSATLILLLDATRSMTVPDEMNGRTRWQALVETVAEAREALQALDEEVEVKAFTFDAEPHLLEVEDGSITLGDGPTGNQTAIGYVLEEVLRSEEGKRLLGVILLSDGAQQALAPRDVPPQTAIARTKHMGYPLYTVAFGGSRGLGQAKDIAVTSLSVEDAVFVNNVLEVSSEVRLDGYVRQSVPVELLFETAPGKMEVVDKRTLTPNSDGQLMPVRLEHVPKTHGEFKLSVRVAEQPGELNTKNNQRSTFVNVLKGGLKVLYLEGLPRPEEKWIRRALDAADEINVDYHRLNVQMLQRPADFAEWFQPGKYDVYILGDLDSEAFRPIDAGDPNFLADLVEAVDRGAGLIMIGGFHSFGPGGYANTPLARLIPVRMDRLLRQEFGKPPRPDAHISGWIRMEPTTFGINHYTLMLAGDIASNRRLWAELPKLRGANRFDKDLASRTAVVLATTENGDPLLVRDNYGAGRVMAFAADTTWLWWMGGFEKAHKRFWRQMILWLARKDEALEGRVWVKLDQRRFALGELVPVTAGAETPEGDPIADATFKAEVIDPQGNRFPVQMVRQEERVKGTFRKAQDPGDYTVEVTAVQDGETLGTARARFVVFEQDLELDNAAADAKTLDAIAGMTGGELRAPEELPELIRSLGERTEVLEVTKETKKSLWDTWAYFFAFVGLLGVEWFLRKKWGLV